ncbi:Ger(x)C family spore germination protein [Virgibacillus profundi]|uniref:Ger(x)C family spore germination protein n=1 Tax=Virgibacillus profundi TaxID=2024555 RepID=UPI0013FDF3CA|nr:Ger(x)C family spore germination protein [Virgibacillus profundi]
MKQIRKLSIGILLLVSLTGCWDEKEIGEHNYATAIGIDYKEEKYLLYVQMLDFSNVAKQEGQKQSEEAPLYIGKSSGATLQEAVNDLYKTSQQPFNWGQIGSIIYSEAVLKNGIEKVQQAIQRNGEFRYTPWMFGTRESIDELFGLTGFFHLPPLYTIMYQPEDIHGKYSYIKPLRMHKFISIYKDPGGTAILPSISIDKSAWKKAGPEEKAKKTLKINGGFQINEGKYKDWMSYEELTGLRWVESKTENTTVKLVDEGNIIGNVEISSPSAKIKQVGEGDNAQFNIIIKATGILADLKEELPIETIEKLVTKQIEEDVKTTYQKGMEKQIDIYNLKHRLFLNGMKPEELKEYTLSEDSLNLISVDFLLESKGIYH